MGEAKDSDFNLVMSWTIDNFSCWNGEIHGTVMTTEGFWFCGRSDFKLELYPRGLIGRGEHLVVRICDHESSSEELWIGQEESGELSFFGSDGSLLCMQEVSGRMGRGSVEFPPGPKFQEVVARIRKNEPMHEDRITLRLRFRDGDKEESFLYHMHSRVDVFETSLQISFALKDIAVLDESYVVEYPLNEDRMEVIALNIQTDPSIEQSKILLFSLVPESFKNKFAVHISMSVLKSDDSALATEENEYLFREDEVWTFSDKLTREEVKENGLSIILNIKIIPNNGFKHLSGRTSAQWKEITITPITVSRPPSNELNEDANNQPEPILRELSKELMCLYQDQDFSDITLNCGTVSFPVHRNILSARSPVFKTMLSSDMRESVSGSVDIEDLDVPTLARFLAFLYTGSVEEQLQGESALKLYYAADKYQVPTLKKECVDFLSVNVSISNVCDVLSLADKHRDEKLITVVHDFILGNYGNVLRSVEWKGFMKSEPLLAVETLSFLAERREK